MESNKTRKFNEPRALVEVVVERKVKTGFKRRVETDAEQRVVKETGQESNAIASSSKDVTPPTQRKKRKYTKNPDKRPPSAFTTGACMAVCP